MRARAPHPAGSKSSTPPALKDAHSRISARGLSDSRSGPALALTSRDHPGVFTKNESRVRPGGGQRCVSLNEGNKPHLCSHTARAAVAWGARFAPWTPFPTRVVSYQTSSTTQHMPDSSSKTARCDIYARSQQARYIAVLI